MELPPARRQGAPLGGAGDQRRGRLPEPDAGLGTDRLEAPRQPPAGRPGRRLARARGPGRLRQGLERRGRAARSRGGRRGLRAHQEAEIAVVLRHLRGRCEAERRGERPPHRDVRVQAVPVHRVQLERAGLLGPGFRRRHDAAGPAGVRPRCGPAGPPALSGAGGVRLQGAGRRPQRQLDLRGVLQRSPVRALPPQRVVRLRLVRFSARGRKKTARQQACPAAEQGGGCPRSRLHSFGTGNPRKACRHPGG
mmetsp:Transcript_104684/g.305618  ORF Transcript_104684/g.305618 Transcript_104684/m.305618 type:complete len:251 (-) Transcript_104684:578-1330(-)